jgi:hypothetical protein
VASRVLARIAERVDGRRCILFLGAGVHAPPPDGSPFEYPLEQRPPVGSQLSHELALACDFATRFPREDAGNLQRVALAYELDREGGGSRAALVDAIADAVEANTAPSPMVSALARLDFPIVVTTNYDQLFEHALRDAGKEPRVAVYNPRSEGRTTVHEDPTPESPVIYKLHGDIGERGSLVVTDEDYIQFVLRMRDKEPCDPIPLSLKESLTKSTTLLVGYSLLDYNLRLLFKTLRWGIDPANLSAMYSVDLRPDSLIKDVWQSQLNYVNFIADDVWSFVPRLYEHVRGERLTP